MDYNRSLTFLQYKEKVYHLACGLQKSGIKKGDRIGVLGKNSLEYFLLYGAAAALGAILLPINWRLSAEEVGFNLNDCEPKLVFADKEFQELVQGLKTDLASVENYYNLGPEGGDGGGEVIAQGKPQDICDNPASLTGRYRSGSQRIAVPPLRTPADEKRMVTVHKARGNNLKGIDAKIPVGLMTCVTGVSGSGKSTLVNDTLYKSVAEKLLKTSRNPAPHAAIEGLEHIDKVIDISQSPIGRTPRSNPATYTGLFTPIRELFAGTQEARSRGYKPGRFSFNVKGGRCEACQGDGVIKVEMHFLPDIYVPCDLCKGKRYNRETLDIRYKGRNITEVLDMTIEDAVDFFSAVPVIARKLQTLLDVGLSYISLGQNATTLSGGEAQRVKLSRELSKRDTGKTLYILDEPTTGLHFHDIEQLLGVLHRLRDHGNTVVIIEHNLDVIKTADWVIDLGPEGGNGGGEIIAIGTPEQVADNPGSHTGRFLKPVLQRQQNPSRTATM